MKKREKIYGEEEERSRESESIREEVETIVTFRGGKKNEDRN